jgi:acetyl-CoA carboxylase biotin carboxylase subunit
VAKVITHGHNRGEAIARMRRALAMFRIEGIQTSIPFHNRILAHADFLSGQLDTGFLTRL